MEKKEYVAFIFAHFALFVVFVWFGGLKVLGLSPATPLVTELYNHTLGLVIPVAVETFVRWFGAFEVLIGVLFVIPKMEKVAIGLLIPHMVTTMLPLIFLPNITWTGFFVPTLEGQYIIKNLIILALVAAMFVDLHKNHKEV